MKRGVAYFSFFVIETIGGYCATIGIIKYNSFEIKTRLKPKRLVSKICVSNLGCRTFHKKNNAEFH